MIEQLASDFKNGRMEVGNKYNDFELLMRTLAKESRYNRNLLSKEFIDTYNSPNIRAHVCSSYSGIVYVFMFPKREESREYRRAELTGRCLIVRRLTKGIDTVIGISTEKKDGEKGFSFDFVYFYKPELTEDEIKEADKLVNEFGWFKNPKGS